jgi:hypothetical protein
VARTSNPPRSDVRFSHRRDYRRRMAQIRDASARVATSALKKQPTNGKVRKAAVVTAHTLHQFIGGFSPTAPPRGTAQVRGWWKLMEGENHGVEL